MTLSWVNFLIQHLNKIVSKNIQTAIIASNSLILGSFFKIYCFKQSVFQNSGISAIVWTNIVGFLVSLVGVFYSRSSIYNNIWINIFKGITSFINFYLYWNYATKFLNQSEIIIGESLCEWVKILVVMFFSNNKQEFIICSLISVYYTFKFILIQNQLSKEIETSLNLIPIIKSLFWITFPRLVTSYLDVVYSNLKTINPIVDSFWTSGTILILSLGLFLYLNLRYGYYEEGFKPNFANLFSSYLKSEIRIAGNYLTNVVGFNEVLALDKFSFGFFHIWKSMKDTNLTTSSKNKIKISNNSFYWYFLDGIMLILQNLYSKLMRNISFHNRISITQNPAILTLPFLLIITVYYLKDAILFRAINYIFMILWRISRLFSWLY